MSDATSQQFCTAHAGVNYSAIIIKIQAIDFGDCYPVVDNNGNLTGECLPGDTEGYSICDINSDGVPRVHEHAVDAMIRK
jgi:hypothetical protein